MATTSTGMTALNEEIYEELVDALNKLFGVHPGFRAAHAKGVICEGTFAPSPTAGSLSRAVHFQTSTGTVPVTARFSDSTGMPTIPDGDPNASPRGLGLKFHLPNGQATDVVAQSFNAFPVGTAEEFLSFLLAIAASGPEAAGPTPIEQFLDTHPRAKYYVTTPKPATRSFARTPFFALHAFQFTNHYGKSQFARYQIHPIEGEAHFSDPEAAKQPPNYLFDELAERLARGPAKLKLVAQLAAAGDKIDDASVTWPAERPQVELGVITIAKQREDSDEAQKKLIFDPANLTDGIALSSDPLPAARSAVYSIAYKRRNAQNKPSAEHEQT